MLQPEAGGICGLWLCQQEARGITAPAMAHCKLRAHQSLSYALLLLLLLLLQVCGRAAGPRLTGGWMRWWGLRGACGELVKLMRANFWEMWVWGPHRWLNEIVGSDEHCRSWEVVGGSYLQLVSLCYSAASWILSCALVLHPLYRLGRAGGTQK